MNIFSIDGMTYYIKHLHYAHFTSAMIYNIRNIRSKHATYRVTMTTVLAPSSLELPEVGDERKLDESQRDERLACAEPHIDGLDVGHGRQSAGHGRPLGGQRQHCKFAHDTIL